jgi:hypothetical protein
MHIPPASQTALDQDASLNAVMQAAFSFV